MHKLYTHKGVVLSSRGVGEKNSVITLLSEGLGLVRGKAISSRMAAGKLKGHLIPYTLGTYTLVRAKDGWRLIQADAEANIYLDQNSLAKKKIVARVCKLISKIASEVPEKNLYYCAYYGFKALKQVDDFVLKTFEVAMVARILHILGYLSFENFPEILKKYTDYTDETLLAIKHHEKELVKLINQGLRESQLIDSV